MASDPGAGQVPSAEQLLAWTDRGAPWPPSVATPAFADVPAAYRRMVALRRVEVGQGQASLNAVGALDHQVAWAVPPSGRQDAGGEGGALALRRQTDLAPEEGDGVVNGLIVYREQAIA